MFELRFLFIQKTVARALLPHLLKEQLHILNPEVIRRPRETDVRATCGELSKAIV